MFEIVFLGTSAAAPTTYRGLTSQMILAGEHRFLIDCGEGTQRQILQSGLGFKKLNKMLFTHGHLDHILGFGGLISTLVRWENLEKVEVWGGSSTLERLQNLVHQVVFLGQSLPLPLTFQNLEKDKIFFETKKYTVTAFPVKHQGPGNFGFVFQEKSHRVFLVEKAEALGVPNGPLRGQLVAGHSITLPDGRVIEPDEVLDSPQAGIKLVHVGDCGNVSNLYEVAQNADCLIMEATYLDSEEANARDFGHMTAGGSARFAREVNAKALILNHISRRSREYEIRQEAQAIFPNTFVARDFDHFILNKGKPITKNVAQADPEEY